MRCEPANTIINKFGDLKSVADATGVTVHSVMRWRRERKDGGTGGVIPHWHMASLLKSAKEEGIELKPADFLPLSSHSTSRESA